MLCLFCLRDLLVVWYKFPLTPLRPSSVTFLFCSKPVKATSPARFWPGLRRVSNFVDFRVEFQVTRISTPRNFLWQNLPADLQYSISWYINSMKCRPNSIPNPNPNPNPNPESFHQVESRVTRKSTQNSTRWYCSLVSDPVTDPVFDLFLVLSWFWAGQK